MPSSRIMTMSPVFQPRHRKVKHKILEKIHVDFYRYCVCLAILSLSIVTLFLSWGALEIEEFGNKHFNTEPNSGTASTCFYTAPFAEDGHQTCDKFIKNHLSRNIVYYGIRLDCIMSSPLIMISFWFFWHETFGKRMLLFAHFCAWIKSISITAVLTCVLMDDPTFMREVFEKSQLGSYESKLLYSFTMMSFSACFDICLAISLVMASLIPEPASSKYQEGQQQPAGDMHRFQNTRVLANVKQIVAKNRTSRVSVVEAIPVGDLFTKTQFPCKSNPV